MNWKIEVSYKTEMPDAIGQGIVQDIADLGIDSVTSVRTAQLYWIEGNIDSRAIERICSELLADPVTQDYVYSEFNSRAPEQGKVSPPSTNAWTIEVRFKPGVTDAVGDSVLKGIRDSGILGVQSAQTGQKYWIRGNLDHARFETIAHRLLANEVIQAFEICEEA